MHNVAVNQSQLVEHNDMHVYVIYTSYISRFE